MATVDTVRMEDELPVQSRVSWGGIFSGAAVAIALYVLLVALGAAIGISASEEGRVGTGTGIYAFVISLVCLFAGGWVTSQFTVGESKFESAIYGAVLWALVFGGLSLLSVIGVRNVNMMSQFAGERQRNAAAIQQELQSRGITLTPEQTEKLQMQSQQQSTDQGAQANSPEERQKSRSAVAWYGFFGILLTMAASIAGTLVGSGPNLVARWGTFVPRTRVVVPPPPPPAR